MAQPRQPLCAFSGCTEPKKQRPNGKPYSYCSRHLWKGSRDKDRAALHNGQVALQVEATRSEFAPPSQQPVRLLIINPVTQRAFSYEVLLATPVRAIVPDDPEKYGAFIRGAQLAGYTVVIEA